MQASTDARQSPGALPNLIVIGAQKCGTTSLHAYLDLHPQISMAKDKELDFFVEELNWNKGIPWYSAQFEAEAPVRGESSPSYSAVRRFPGVPQRMRRVTPDAKLVLLVRDPIERLISQYVHEVAKNKEQRCFAEVARDDRYVERSMYWLQLSAYLEHFPASAIRVIDALDLRDRRRETMRRLFELVDVDPGFYSRLFQVEHNRFERHRRKTPFGLRLASSRLSLALDRLPNMLRWRARDLLYYPFSRPIEPPVLSEADRRYLIEQLHDDAHRFRQWTGFEFANWIV